VIRVTGYLNVFWTVGCLVCFKTVPIEISWWPLLEYLPRIRLYLGIKIKIIFNETNDRRLLSIIIDDSIRNTWSRYILLWSGRESILEKNVIIHIFKIISCDKTIILCNNYEYYYFIKNIFWLLRWLKHSYYYHDDRIPSMCRAHT